MVLDMLLLLSLQSKAFLFFSFFSLFFLFFFFFFFWLLNEVLTFDNDRLGLKIAIADCDEKNLAQVGIELTSLIGQSNVLVIPTDVSKLDQVVKLRDKVYETWGEVRILFVVLLCAFSFRSLANLRFRRKPPRTG